MAKNKAPSPRPESDGSDAGDQQQQQQMDAGDEEEEEQVFEVEKIVSHKVTFDDNNLSVTRFIVKWKGYPSSDNTEEPAHSLMDGAKALLVEYMAQQEDLGVSFYQDGTKRKRCKAYEYVKPPKASRKSEPGPGSQQEKREKKKPRDSEIAEQASQSSSQNRSKEREKEREREREREREADRESQTQSQPAPPKKKPRVEELRSASPPAAVAPLSSSSSTKNNQNGKVSSASKSKHSEPPASSDSRVSSSNNNGKKTSEKLAPAAPPAKTSNKIQSRKSTSVVDGESDIENDQSMTELIKAKLPKEVAPQPEPESKKSEVVGSTKYSELASWDSMVSIDTLEQEDVLRWYITWNSLGTGEWVNNEVGRVKFPQRIIDFYQAHLKFKMNGEEEEDGDAMMED